MRRAAFLLAIVAPLGVTACGSPSEPASVGNNAEMIADALERRADNLEAMANASANDGVAAMLVGAADNLDDQADNIAEAAGDNAR